jgi:hypothetical protein
MRRIGCGERTNNPLGMYRIQYKTNYPLYISEIDKDKKWIIIIWI